MFKVSTKDGNVERDKTKGTVRITVIARLQYSHTHHISIRLHIQIVIHRYPLLTVKGTLCT